MVTYRGVAQPAENSIMNRSSTIEGISSPSNHDCRHAIRDRVIHIKAHMLFNI